MSATQANGHAQKKRRAITKKEVLAAHVLKVTMEMVNISAKVRFGRALQVEWSTSPTKFNRLMPKCCRLRLQPLFKCPYCSPTSAKTLKKALYLSVNVFSTKVLTGDTIFHVSYWRWDRRFTWSSEPHESLPFCRAKGVRSFLSYFKTLSIGPVSGIEPVTSRSAVKRSGRSYSTYRHSASKATFCLLDRVGEKEALFESRQTFEVAAA